jgi:hypothetical protein
MICELKFYQAKINYMYKTIVAAIVLIVSLSFSRAFAQTIIHGKVIDEITREPLEQVVLNNFKTFKSTLTDRQGNFSLKNTTSGDSIIISSIGYKVQKIMIDSSNKQLIVRLEKSHVDLREVVINGQYNNLTTSHALSRIDLDRQPVKSAQDLLRLIPGLFIAQHQGGGKAEQIFLRGFDADHGTDVNVSVDGIPVNMVSHAHGQGYADLHFLIPETVAGYEFGKGPYYTDRGDFCTAGYVAYNTVNVLNQNMVKIEGGQFDNFRALSMINLLSNKAKEKQQSAYIAGEGLYFNGPFDYPEHFNRFNLFGKFITPLGTDTKLTLELSTLSSGWRASGEIPNRAVSEGYIPDRFDVLDSAQGGYTSRTNASIKLVSNLKNNFILENQVWYSHYYFNLITNFTFYYYFPTTGDEFRQHEMRDLGGYNTKLYKQAIVGNTTFTSEIGAGFRYDHIDPSELDHTMNGNFISYLQYGKTSELNANAYFSESVTKGKWLFNAGARIDYFHFYYLNMAPVSDTFASKIYNIAGINPDAQKVIISPKLNIQYTFNPKFQLYIKAGKGFHSNDARVVIANQGYSILPAAYGADLGYNWKPFPRLFINDALWYLYLQEEFTFGQDLIDQPGGPIQPSGKTCREGNDFSARYQINNWLFASMNLNFANPKFIDSAAGHNYLPLAPTLTSTAGLDFRFENGLNGGLSYRYLHNRAANSTYTLTALGYWVTDLTVNYTKNKYEVGIAIENLFNVAWNESQFEYTSRLKNETQPVDEVSYTPGTPFFAKLKLAVFF